jgi:hypothetical protein
MSFAGEYGHLTAVEAAKLGLVEISQKISQDEFYRTSFETPLQQYEHNRLLSTVEGLQMVLAKNNSPEPHTWLPPLYNPKNQPKVYLCK